MRELKARIVELEIWGTKTWATTGMNTDVIDERVTDQLILTGLEEMVRQNLSEAALKTLRE